MKTHDLKMAVIVNDMSELNIDASLVAHGSLIQAEEKLVEMQNGCICCTLREDLLEEIKKLASSNKFEYVLIESTGIGEPQQVAETFELHVPESGYTLSDIAYIDTMVTVVDSSNLMSNLSSIKNLSEQEGREVAGGERNVADLLLDQIEFANVIILNKTDLISQDMRAQLEAFLRALNPRAKVICCQESKVSWNDVINTHLFSMDEARQSAGWLLSLTEGHTPETEEYGISSFIYSARAPFHPEKIWNFFNMHWTVQEVVPGDESDEDGPEFEICTHDRSDDIVEKKTTRLHSTFGQILRSKGFMWLKGRDDLHGELSQAGSILRISPGAPWFAAIPEEMWEGVDHEGIKKDMEGPWGDRRQEIVFIGINMKRQVICDALDACLCPGPVTRSTADPFMQWPKLELVEISDSDDDMDEIL